MRVLVQVVAMEMITHRESHLEITLPSAALMENESIPSFTSELRI